MSSLILLVMSIKASVPFVFSAYSLLSLSTCLVIPTTAVIIKKNISEEYLTLVISFFYTSVPIGAIVASLIVSQAESWNSIFYISSGITFVCGSLGSFLMLRMDRKAAENQTSNTDVPSDQRSKFCCSLGISSTKHKLQLGLITIGCMLREIQMNVPINWTSYFSHEFLLMPTRQSTFLSIAFDCGELTLPLLMLIDHKFLSKISSLKKVLISLPISLSFLSLLYTKNVYLTHSLFFVIGITVAMVKVLFSGTYLITFAKKFNDNSFVILSFVQAMAYFGQIVQGPVVMIMIHATGSI